MGFRGCESAFRNPKLRYSLGFTPSSGAGEEVGASIMKGATGSRSVSGIVCCRSRFEADTNERGLEADDRKMRGKTREWWTSGKMLRMQLLQSHCGTVSTVKYYIEDIQSQLKHNRSPTSLLTWREFIPTIPSRSNSAGQAVPETSWGINEKPRSVKHASR